MSERAADARRRADLAAADAARETEAAQGLIDDFVRRAGERGLAPQPLLAVTPRGARVRTGLSGWYLRRNQTLAVTDDGGYVILTLAAEPSLLERLRGVRVLPTPPSLTVGRGGRDGESGDLSDYLDAALGA